MVHKSARPVPDKESQKAAAVVSQGKHMKKERRERSAKKRRATNVDDSEDEIQEILQRSDDSTSSEEEEEESGSTTTTSRPSSPAHREPRPEPANPPSSRPPSEMPPPSQVPSRGSEAPSSSRAPTADRAVDFGRRSPAIPEAVHPERGRRVTRTVGGVQRRDRQAGEVEALDAPWTSSCRKRTTGADHVRHHPRSSGRKTCGTTRRVATSSRKTVTVVRLLRAAAGTAVTDAPTPQNSPDR